MLGLIRGLKKKNGYFNLKSFSPITKLDKIKLVKKQDFTLFKKIKT